jgi:hypothetical protein
MAAKKYVIVLSIIMLVLGLFGFFYNPFLGILRGNNNLHIVYLFIGALGMILGIQIPRDFSLWTGWFVFVIGVLGFIPVAGELIAVVLRTNTASNLLHIGIGVVSIMVGYFVDD